MLMNHLKLLRINKKEHVMHFVVLHQSFEAIKRIEIGKRYGKNLRLDHKIS